MSKDGKFQEKCESQSWENWAGWSSNQEALKHADAWDPPPNFLISLTAWVPVRTGAVSGLQAA